MEPLIYTSKGNLPLAELEERVVWTDNADETICAFEHWYQGERVRNQVNIYKRTGLEVLGQTGVI